MPKRRASMTGRQLTTVVDNRGGPRMQSRRSNSAFDREVSRSTITVRVPLSTQQRGTRKVIITPAGEQAWLPQRARIDDTLIKAIARGYRWNKMLKCGEYSSVTELAGVEDVTESYLARI